MKDENINLITEQVNLYESLLKKNNEIEQLIKEVKAHQIKNVHSRIIVKKSGAFNNIAGAKESFYNTQLGFAHEKQVINLIQIKGIGLWVEEKYMFDIYTFDQINKLMLVNVKPIKEVVEISPDIPGN